MSCAHGGAQHLLAFTPQAICRGLTFAGAVELRLRWYCPHGFGVLPVCRLCRRGYVITESADCCTVVLLLYIWYQYQLYVDNSSFVLFSVLGNSNSISVATSVTRASSYQYNIAL